MKTQTSKPNGVVERACMSSDERSLRRTLAQTNSHSDEHTWTKTLNWVSSRGDINFKTNTTK